jgi:hypothetical protein
MTVFGFGGIFTVFTYIVPILTSEAHLGEATISWVLILFGLGATGGTLLGGRLADWKLMPALAVALATLCAFFLLFAGLMHLPAFAVASVFLIGFIGFLGGPALQARSVQQASLAGREPADRRPRLSASCDCRRVSHCGGFGSDRFQRMAGIAQPANARLRRRCGCVSGATRDNHWRWPSTRSP